jgi:hypothetical protein
VQTWPIVGPVAVPVHGSRAPVVTVQFVLLLATVTVAVSIVLPELLDVSRTARVWPE